MRIIQPHADVNCTAIMQMTWPELTGFIPFHLAECFHNNMWSLFLSRPRHLLQEVHVEKESIRETLHDYRVPMDPVFHCSLVTGLLLPHASLQGTLINQKLVSLLWLITLVLSYICVCYYSIYSIMLCFYFYIKLFTSETSNLNLWFYAETQENEEAIEE